jgi:hypothetical protein
MKPASKCTEDEWHSLVTIDKMISLIRGSEEGGTSQITTEIFSNGNCANFALMLWYAFAGSRLVSSCEIPHVWVEYGGVHYDIKGRNPSLKTLFENGDAKFITWEEAFRDVDNYSFKERGPIC